MSRKNTHEEAIRKANAYVGQAVAEAETDNHRPRYHAVAPVNWLNDPNGLIHYRGEYHLYYQHNPYSVQWGNIHWAHMKSKDLVHWEHLPIALAPSEDYDRDGCFSGSAIEHEDKLYVFYTANLFTSPQGLPDDLLQQQGIAVSEDGGVTFAKYAGNPIIASPPEHIGQTNHFRDPKVWKHGESWYMVLGAKKNGLGKVVLYRSVNLTDWEFFSVLTESDGPLGYMFECPDLFRLGDKEVLLFSPEGALGEPRLSGYYVGELDYETGIYKHGEFRKLDHGFDFYAPQTMHDAQGRRILIGWMPMDGEALGKSWAGTMTLPRELRLTDDNRLQFLPVEELKTIRHRKVEIESLSISGEDPVTVEGIEGNGVEIRASFDLSESTASEFGIEVLASADGSERTVIGYRAAEDEVFFDRTLSGDGLQGIKKCTTGKVAGNQLTLQLFVDRSIVEIYVNDGQQVMSGFVFPRESGKNIRFYAKGGTAMIERLDFWSLER